ncbi:Fe-S cluster domain protein [Methanotorris formicicus Mc-S-70]|uniref:Fe-S cluster domain protein n=1 Tax=Methanotorris formicicus Mc-S-70 TaxID=647171 RepID=H1L0U9_9EURY|nr:Fe-S cluster domain protein [Methanotorris formicicus Mc-S-70]
MVIAFEGTVKEGKIPEVGKTVKFLPEHCMMQKVHSGVVVEVEGKRVYIEGIDLKVF